MFSQGGRSLPPGEELRNYCTPDMGEASRFYIVLLDDDPIDFLQSYSPVEGLSEGWWLDARNPGARGIDQFLADAGQLKGLGAKMIRAFTAMLFENPQATRIQLDPEPSNNRSSRCYEKPGCRRVREVVTPDGPALLMYWEGTSAF
jgi:RimJ/RimL family protein N-acetyltransferase